MRGRRASISVNAAPGRVLPISCWRRISSSVHLGAASVPALLALIGIVELIVPMFGRFAPIIAFGDFVNHVALAAGALDTIRETHSFPISTDETYPGIEYPYFLFGNTAFYVLASVISFTFDLPAYLGVAATLALAFALGVVGTFLMARQRGLSTTFSAMIGFLYAAGPY